MIFPPTRHEGMGANRPAALIGQFYAERNREYPLEVPVMTVGRGRANALRIRDSRVSEEHIRIVHDAAGYVMEVVAADAPTALNGAKLPAGERRTLSHGDVISLSDLEFLFASDDTDRIVSRLWVLSGVHRGKSFRIDRADVRVGRAMDNDVQFPDRAVSRHHCCIRRQNGDWWIEDLSSTNGTLLNGIPLIDGPARLAHGDEVRAGFSHFVFQESGRPLEDRGRPEGSPACN